MIVLKGKKVSVLRILLLIVGFFTYSFCVFVLFEDYTSKFWSLYIFTVIAFLSLVIIPSTRNSKEDNFLNLPLFVLNGVYFTVQLIVGIILMLLPVSMKFALVIEIIILGCFVIIALAAVIGKEKVSSLDKATIDNTEFMKELILRAEIVYNNENNPAKKVEFKKLYEAIRYSDPVSADAQICLINEQIKDSFDIVCNDIGEKSIGELSQEIKTTMDLITKRNLTCKTKKQ